MAELMRRYVVMPMATEGPFDLKDPDGTFVLKPWKDPAALGALEAYRDRCYPELARDLGAWIKTIRSGPVVRGGVGTRNALYAARASKPGTPGAVPRARPEPPKVKSKRRKDKARKKQAKQGRK
jgi:hypothetical protein